MILTGAAIVMLVGVLMYALCANGKLAEIGRLMFFAGLLVVLFSLGGVARLPLGR